VAPAAAWRGWVLLESEKELKDQLREGYRVLVDYDLESEKELKDEFAADIPYRRAVGLVNWNPRRN
jgi:hypothetical protein